MGSRLAPRVVAATLAATLLVACGGSETQTEPDAAQSSASTPTPIEEPTVSSEPDVEPSTAEPANDTVSPTALYPDVVDVSVTATGDRVFTFATTLSSPYDSPERYADAWRITSTDGSVVYGIRELAHDHAGEQPFTRSVSGVAIPAEVDEVLVEGRDQVSGWGGATMVVAVP